MQNISIQRYSTPQPGGWAGCIEPDDRSWIIFIHSDGRTAFFDKRDPSTGAVLS